MTSFVLATLLALAAMSLGLRTSSVLIPRVHPVPRLLVSMVIGSALVMVTMEIADSYLVHDLGLGLLVSLSPVGFYDLAKWWFRWRR
jgi:hypothetical protein